MVMLLLAVVDGRIGYGRPGPGGRPGRKTEKASQGEAFSARGI